MRNGYLDSLLTSPDRRFPKKPVSTSRWARWANYNFMEFLRQPIQEPKDDYWIDILPALEHFNITEISPEVEILPFEWINTYGCISWLQWSNYKTGEPEYSFTVRLPYGHTAESASAVMWHELCHVAQMDRMTLSEFNSKYKATTVSGEGWRKYANSPLEAEAYRAMNNHFNVIPLAWSR